jgi:hypothetical protein
MLLLVTVTGWIASRFRQDNRERIQEAAIVEAMRRTSLPRNAIRVHDVEFDNHEYWVVVDYQPATPGSHALLTFSSDGKFKNYEPGE